MQNPPKWRGLLSRPASCAHQHRAVCSLSTPAGSIVCALALALTTGLLADVQAQAGAGAEAVVITGSVVQRRIDEAPFAITSLGRDELRAAGPMINLSEALVRVPGLVANNRLNFAQDLQIGSRGFGARATFGVRGIRLYADGIPASGPDGQGQVSHMDLAGAQRVEVLRGPYSALYGNSSGGVIAVFTAPVQRAEWELGIDAGSFGLRQLRGGVALRLGQQMDLRASGSGAQIDGFRPQSRADKRQANARLGWQDGRDQVVLLLNILDQPAQDPLGLTREQFLLGPQEVAAVAQQFDTRKTQRQTQLGASWRHRFEAGALRESQLAAYAGRRAIVQFLAIPASAQASPRHGGGVVDFDRGYQGLEARLRWAWEALDLTAGVALDLQNDDRRGWANFIGSGATQQLGVIGALRRDEVNRASSRDAFAQAEWRFAPQWMASAGLRSGQVELSSRDAYLSNGDDSGRVDYDYQNPVLGLRWQPSPGLHVFASAARGFESPTLGELAYRSDGTGGFNTALLPQRSRQAEVGLRLAQPGWRAELTVFDIRTSDEIGVATNTGGRSAFQNVGRTRRRGAELALDAKLAPAWRAQASSSWLRAVYLDHFTTCAGTPCTAPTVRVPAGHRIAGAPKAGAWAELVWQGGGWGTWGLAVKSTSAYFANDRNTDAAAVSSHVISSLRWSKTYALGPSGLRWEWLLRVDNLANRQHAGSVIVNDGNGRFFEPGTPRQVLLALRVLGGL